MDLSQLEGKKVMVTGATGLIGRTIVDTLLNWNSKAKDSIHIIALVRNEKKAKKMFADVLSEKFQLLVSDVCALEVTDIGVDYIIHTASQTSSKAFVNEPVETIMIGLNGTKKMLDFAVANKVKGFVYLSSMEVYGCPATDEKVNEGNSTNLDTMSVRSCYPESKRMCENLCTSYVAEYGVPAMAVRLTQTFGPGVEYNDGRVFAEFARCAIEGRNIVLNTKGETKRCYLHTKDAVNAILTVLLHGKSGEAYNAANEETYCSICEMARLVAEKCSEFKIDVVINEGKDISQFGYAPTLKMNLDTRKLQKLGWQATINLEQMLKSMIKDMKEG